VVFDLAGRILLREPSNHYGGYHWTFPKGRPDPGEHPLDTALRETLEETGHRPVVVGHLPGRYAATATATSNYFYVMEDDGTPVDDAARVADGETSALAWATEDEAERLIGTTANPDGRRRDLEVLHAAFALRNTGPVP
jgi:8-oxo-dGTP diphosphatase